MNPKHFYTFLLVIFLFPIIALSQTIPPSQLMLKSTFYTKAEYSKLMKGNKEASLLGGFLKDTVQMNDAKIYLGSDGTFNYQIVLDIRLSNGEVGSLTIPFANMSLGGEYDYTKNSLKVSADKQSWMFKVKLKGGNISPYRSEMLAVPSQDDTNHFIYTFTSKDQGKTWAIDLNVTDKDE
jgi:hypothetical protein